MVHTFFTCLCGSVISGDFDHFLSDGCEPIGSCTIYGTLSETDVREIIDAGREHASHYRVRHFASGSIPRITNDDYSNLQAGVFNALAIEAVIVLIALSGWMIWRLR